MKYVKYLNKLSLLENKNIIVTGANSGLGFELSRNLLFLKAHLIMACRNEKRAEEAKEKLLKEFPQSKITIMIYDQASMNSIKTFVDELLKMDFHLDGLVCNAGVYYPKKDMKTSDGFELTVGTNYLGVTYLLDLLEEKLIKDQTRVVVVSSLIGTLSKWTSFDKIYHLSRHQRYAFSKRLLSTSIYERMELNKYPLTLVHPGICATNILNNKDTGLSSNFAKIGRGFLNIFVHSASKASLSLLLGLVSEYQPFMYIAPRGIFAISGYPRIKKIPKKFKKYKVLEKTRDILTESR